MKFLRRRGQLRLFEWHCGPMPNDEAWEEQISYYSVGQAIHTHSQTGSTPAGKLFSEEPHLRSPMESVAICPYASFLPFPCSPYQVNLNIQLPPPVWGNPESTNSKLALPPPAFGSPTSNVHADASAQRAQDRGDSGDMCWGRSTTGQNSGAGRDGDISDLSGWGAVERALKGGFEATPASTPHKRVMWHGGNDVGCTGGSEAIGKDMM